MSLINKTKKDYICQSHADSKHVYMSLIIYMRINKPIVLILMHKPVYKIYIISEYNINSMEYNHTEYSSYLIVLNFQICVWCILVFHSTYIKLNVYYD